MLDDTLSVLIYGRNRIGKCLGLGTPVMLIDGTVKNVEDVVEGDQLMGPDSKPRTVLSTNKGFGQLYRIVPNKGDSWVCNDEHILTLTGCNGIPSVEGVVKDISVNDYLNDLDNKVPRSDMWCLFRQPVDFYTDTVSAELFDPYLVGLWMGDGSRGTSNITNRRTVIQDYCRRAAEIMGMVCTVTPDPRDSKNTSRISLTTKKGTGGAGPNRLLKFFQNECAAGEVKRIPHKYLTASREDRLRLLAGILDTDGDDTKKPSTCVTVTGEPYRDGLLFLCRSLGFSAYCNTSKVHTCANGKVSTYFKVVISGDLEEVPTLVKNYNPRRRTNRVTVTRFVVEDEGEGDYYGFTLDGDGRFLLGDFTVTHNTTLAAQFPKPIALCSIEPAKTGGSRSVKNVPGIVGKVVRKSEELLQLGQELDRGGHGIKTVVLDSVSSLEKIVLQEIKGWDVPVEQLRVGKTSTVTTDDYTDRSEQMKKIIRVFLNLSGVNIVILANEKDHNPPEAKQGKNSFNRGMQEDSFFAADTGAGMARWLMDSCDFILQMFEDAERIEKKVQIMAGQPMQSVWEETGKRIRRLRLGYHPQYAAGARVDQYSSGKTLPEFIDGKNPMELYKNFREAVK